MEECSVYHNVAFPTHYQTKRLSHLEERPFDPPPALLVWQLLSALHRWLFPLIAIHTDQLDSSVALTFPQCIRFMGFLINGPLRALGRMAAQGDSESLKRRFHQRSFGESYRLQEVAQRYSWAADLYHPLLDTVFSFFAGTKLPSSNAVPQLRSPWALWWARENHCLGRSSQRAAGHNIHRMPLKQGWFGIGLGLLQKEAWVFGSRGAIFPFIHRCPQIVVEPSSSSWEATTPRKRAKFTQSCETLFKR